MTNQEAEDRFLEVSHAESHKTARGMREGRFSSDVPKLEVFVFTFDLDRPRRPVILCDERRNNNAVKRGTDGKA
jgi:hypothetical protein